jgi:hypothetical protein
LKGYRVLDIGETKTEDEEYYMDEFDKLNSGGSPIKSESATQFVDRLCDEYDKNESYKVETKEHTPDIKDDVEYDSDIDTLIHENTDRTPSKNIKTSKNNIEINLDDNGIKLPKKSVKSKTVNTNGKQFAMMGRDNSDDEDTDTDTDLNDD